MISMDKLGLCRSEMEAEIHLWRDWMLLKFVSLLSSSEFNSLETTKTKDTSLKIPCTLASSLQLQNVRIVTSSCLKKLWSRNRHPWGHQFATTELTPIWQFTFQEGTKTAQKNVDKNWEWVDPMSWSTQSCASPNDDRFFHCRVRWIQGTGEPAGDERWVVDPGRRRMTDRTRHYSRVPVTHRPDTERGGKLTQYSSTEKYVDKVGSS